MLFGKHSLRYKIAYVSLGVVAFALIYAGYKLAGMSCLVAAFTVMVIATRGQWKSPPNRP